MYAKRRTRNLPTHVRDAVYQNCVFQLSAVLEDYLADLLGQWFTNLRARGALNEALPEITRSLAVLRSQEESFRRYIGDKDERGLAERIIASASIFSLLSSASPLGEDSFERLLIKDKKFPSVNNFSTLFKRVGLPKITQDISRRTRTNFELSLQSFMDVRNALAHESPPSITDEDVGRYITSLETWIDAIDREFYSHVVRVSGRGFW